MNRSTVSGHHRANISGPQCRSLTSVFWAIARTATYEFALDRKLRQALATDRQKDRLLPIVREFAELLEAIDDETGRVFQPLLSRRHRQRMRLDTVSRKITAIGQRAQVIVQSGPKPKSASAHDLRRAFGQRWAMKVMPTMLQQLMRHESFETTLKYYVGRNAQAVAETVWNAGGVSTFMSTAKSPEIANDVNTDFERV